MLLSTQKTNSWVI